MVLGSKMGAGWGAPAHLGGDQGGMAACVPPLPRPYSAHVCLERLRQESALMILRPRVARLRAGPGDRVGATGV